MGEKKSKMKREKKNQTRGEGVGRKSNLAGKAPGTQFLHTDIFTTVKASFNAGLCKQTGGCLCFGEIRGWCDGAHLLCQPSSCTGAAKAVSPAQGWPWVALCLSQQAVMKTWD